LSSSLSVTKDMGYLMLCRLCAERGQKMAVFRFCVGSVQMIVANINVEY